MDNNFQDRIDEYLLHGDAMSEEAKAQFLKEIEEDAEKKEQYEFTKSVKQAVTSRGEKLKAMAEFQNEMKRGNRNVWLWVSSVAAVLVVGFFTVNSLFVENSPTDNVRGGENDVFEKKAAPMDRNGNDSTAADTITLKHE